MKSRTIRVFISSTFRDMQAERDYLMTKIFPRLRLLAQERNVCLVEVDLRWGITTEEEGQSGKVVFTCLNEIEHSRPFFIGILGDRYGWCPTEEDLLKNEDFRQRYGWIADDIHNSLSITEIEMQYGVLRSKTPLHAFFFLKRTTSKEEGKGFFKRFFEKSSDEENKLNRLKKQICRNSRYPWAYYECPEDLGLQVEKTFMELLDQLYPSNCTTPLELERLHHLVLRDKRCDIYIETSNYMKEVDDYLTSGQTGIGIIGESGIGKSAFIANWLKRHENDIESDIFYHFVEAHCTPESIIRHFSLELKSFYQITTPKEETRPDYSKELTILLAHPSLHNKRIVFVIDGLDQLPKDHWSQSFCWLPSSVNLQVLLSATKGSTPAIEMQHRRYKIFEIKPLTKEQRSVIAQNYLRIHSKELGKEQLLRISNDNETELPIVLRTLLDELMVYGCYEYLDERIDYYLRAMSIEDFFERVVRRCEQDYGSTLVRKVLTLIAICRKGISENSIVELAGIRQLEWSQFYLGIKTHFISNNGLISFSHQYIQKAVEHLYFSDHNEILKAHQILGEHLRTQIIEQDKLSESDIEEISYQLYMGYEWQELYDFLLDIRVQRYLYFHPNDWALYWNALYKADRNKYNIQAFISILKDDFTTLLELSNMITSYLPQEDITPFAQRIIHLVGSDNVLGRVARFKLVQQLKKEGKLDEAICELEALISVSEVNETLYDNYCNEMGALYIGKKEYVKAEDWFKKTINHLEPKGLRMPALAHAYYNMGDTLLYQQHYDDAVNYLRKALKQYQLTYGKEHIDIIHTLSLLASAFCKKKDFHQALHYCQQEMDMCQHLLDPSDNWIKMTMQNMAFVYEQLGEKEQCARLLAKSQVNKEVDIISRYLANEQRAFEYMQNGDPQYAITLYEEFLHSTESFKDAAALYRARSMGNMALCYEKLKNFDKAFEYHQMSVAVADTITSENIDNIAAVYCNLGINYFNRNLYKDCIAPLKRFIEIKKRPKAKPAPEKVKDCWLYLWSAYEALVNNCRGKANYDDAKKWADCMLEVCREGLGDDSPEMGGTYCQLALISEGLGKIKEAIDYYQLAIEKYILHENRYPMRLYCIHRFIAELQDKQGIVEQTVYHYSQAIHYLEQTGDSNDMPLMYNQLGMVYGRNGQYEESLPYLAKALELATKQYGDDCDSRLYPLYFNIGYTLQKIGKIKEGQKYMDFAEYIKDKTK